MNPLRLCFRCSNECSELLPGDLEASASIVEDLISTTLKVLPFPVIVKPVRLRFSFRENAYIILVSVCYYNNASDEAEEIEVQIEARISRALLQLCQPVSVENYDYWQHI